MNKTLTTLFLLLSIPFISYGQGYVSTDYLSSSSFKDDNGNKYGSGNLMILSGSMGVESRKWHKTHI